jgi:hypothetical protein
VNKNLGNLLNKKECQVQKYKAVVVSYRDYHDAAVQITKHLFDHPIRLLIFPYSVIFGIEIPNHIIHHVHPNEEPHYPHLTNACSLPWFDNKTSHVPSVT